MKCRTPIAIALSSIVVAATSSMALALANPSESAEIQDTTAPTNRVECKRGDKC